MVMSLPASTEDIGSQLSKQFARETEENWKMLLKIISSIKYLARQGLALRGDGDESNGNFIQLLKLQDKSCVDWIQRKCNKYTSHTIQNEILKIMAVHVLRTIATSLQSSLFLTIMIDETTDISNREQVVIVFRSITDSI